MFSSTEIQDISFQLFLIKLTKTKQEQTTKTTKTLLNVLSRKILIINIKVRKCKEAICFFFESIKREVALTMSFWNFFVSVTRVVGRSNFGII